MEPVLTLTDEPDPAAKEAAGAALHQYNVAQTGIADYRPVAVLASDPETGAVLGGLWGRTELGVLFLDMLFLPERLRGRGLGSRMLMQVETEARRRGCRGAVVETSTFQAPGFYLRHGYQELGRVAFTVPGQARVFFRKRLDAAESASTACRQDPEPASEPMETARRRFAEELRHIANLRSPAVVDAFATVPRERFLGSGPWRILSPMYSAGYWTTEDADPRHLYHDVLVAIDESRRLNNGQPSLWAFLYDQLGLATGSHVVHVGAGTGYYSAILAEIVGASGRITAIEIDPALAARARDNLSLTWPQAAVIAADGFAFRPGRPADAVVVNAGVTHLSPAWLDSLAAGNGRLLVPLTNADRWGGFLLITRNAEATRRYPARHVSRTGIIHCVGGRDPESEARLNAALDAAPLTAVRSLRRDPHAEGESCWLHARGWCLSREDPA